MLQSPNHVVLGSSDLEQTERFFGGFGFSAEPDTELPAEVAAALYGLDGPTRQRVLFTHGADHGWIRVVSTPHPARAAGPYDARPVALDLYTRDLRRSVEIARAVGAEVGELVELGGLAMKEVAVVGPDRLTVVFIEADERRPSVLDHDPYRLHSEAHGIVLTVKDADAALPFWTGPAGLAALADSKIEGPANSKLMGLPRPNVPARFVLVGDAESNPSRLGLIELFEDPGGEQPTWPLAAGLHAPAFTVADLDAAMAALSAADFGAPVESGRARAVTGTALGGERFELWQPGG